MCAPRRAAAVVRPREREKSADRRRRILISRLLIIRASVPRRKSPFPAYFKGFPAVSPLIPPYPAFLKYPVSPQAGILFSENYDGLSPDEMLPILRDKIRGAQIRRMVVTMGAQGAVFATLDGEDGYCPAKKVDVKDTTGAGDAFFAGAVIGQTYGKTMMESCEIGTRLAASVITTGENVCPRYLPSEFGLDVSAPDDAQLALEL